MRVEGAHRVRVVHRVGPDPDHGVLQVARVAVDALQLHVDPGLLPHFGDGLGGQATVGVIVGEEGQQDGRAIVAGLLDEFARLLEVVFHRDQVRHVQGRPVLLELVGPGDEALPLPEPFDQQLAVDRQVHSLAQLLVAGHRMGHVHRVDVEHRPDDAEQLDVLAVLQRRFLVGWDVADEIDFAVDQRRDAGGDLRDVGEGDPVQGRLRAVVVVEPFQDQLVAGFERHHLVGPGPHGGEFGLFGPVFLKIGLRHDPGAPVRQQDLEERLRALGVDQDRVSVDHFNAVEIVEETAVGDIVLRPGALPDAVQRKGDVIGRQRGPVVELDPLAQLHLHHGRRHRLPALGQRRLEFQGLRIRFALDQALVNGVQHLRLGVGGVVAVQAGRPVVEGLQPDPQLLGPGRRHPRGGDERQNHQQADHTPHPAACLLPVHPFSRHDSPLSSHGLTRMMFLGPAGIRRKGPLATWTAAATGPARLP